ncbi:hypothetical protein FAV00_000589 [Escherichia coli]|nr:hypothetical protein [Escherichia coli]EGZ1546432.1 hypothetical protein [Escherichia coli]EHL3563235.1 hypothetical protein [Escherichia coli]HCH0524893.1 hypothetical protein [Escherichia coli]HCP8547385.1 hypothetical protein [Escherichia coli]
MSEQNNNPVEILKAVSTLPEDILNISQVCKFLGISNTAVRQRIFTTGCSAMEAVQYYVTKQIKGKGKYYGFKHLNLNKQGCI